MDPRYEIDSRKSRAFQMLPQKYQEGRARLLTLLKGVNYLSITTNCWTSRVVDSYMTVTVHKGLETSLQDFIHSAVGGITHLRQALRCFARSFQCLGVGHPSQSDTDNEAKIKEAIELLRLRHQPCFAHTRTT